MSIKPYTPARGDSPDRLRDAFVQGAELGWSDDEIAQHAGISLEEFEAAIDCPDTIKALLRAHREATTQGTLLGPAAKALTLAMLNKIREAVQIGAADVDDIAGWLPKVHRIAEHADHVAMHQSDGPPRMPVQINFILGGGIQVKPAPASVMVDMDAPHGQDNEKPEDKADKPLSFVSAVNSAIGKGRGHGSK